MAERNWVRGGTIITKEQSRTAVSAGAFARLNETQRRKYIAAATSFTLFTHFSFFPSHSLTISSPLRRTTIKIGVVQSSRFSSRVDATPRARPSKSRSSTTTLSRFVFNCRDLVIITWAFGNRINLCHIHGNFNVNRQCQSR